MEKWMKDKNNHLQQRAKDLRVRIGDLTPEQLEAAEHWGMGVEITNIAYEFDMLLKSLDDATRKR